MDAIGFYWLVWNQDPDSHGNVGVFPGKKGMKNARFHVLIAEDDDAHASARLRPAPARMVSGSISLKWKRRILRGHVQPTSRQRNESEPL